MENIITLKDLRYMKNITQKEIICMLNIKQNTYSQWENNKRLPSIEMLPELAKALNCTIEQVVYALIQTKQNNIATKKQ